MKRTIWSLRGPVPERGVNETSALWREYEMTWKMKQNGHTRREKNSGFSYQSWRLKREKKQTPQTDTRALGSESEKHTQELTVSLVRTKTLCIIPLYRGFRVCVSLISNSNYHTGSASCFSEIPYQAWWGGWWSIGVASESPFSNMAVSEQFMSHISSSLKISCIYGDVDVCCGNNNASWLFFQ